MTGPQWLRWGTWEKQKRTEHLPLSEQALALIVSIVETRDPDTSFFFPGNRPGRPLREIKKFWGAVMRRAGITDYRRHDNRHTYASHLVSSRFSLEIVGRLLGHTTATTTERYAHLLTIRCVPPPIGLDRRSLASRKKKRRMSFHCALELNDRTQLSRSTQRKHRTLSFLPYTTVFWKTSVKDFARHLADPFEPRQEAASRSAQALALATAEFAVP